MDSALLREREAFKRKAMALPTVENKKSKHSSSSSSSSSKHRPPKDGAGTSGSAAKAKLDLQQMKQIASGSSQFKFGVLARIVRCGSRSA